MLRRQLIALPALLLTCPACPASAQERAVAPERIVLIRDAETETLLHKFGDPLFRTANLSSGLVRISLIRDHAINAFVTTGNRMFLNTGLIQQSDSALEVVGTMAHETGHVAHGDITRLPEAERDALLSALGSLLIAAAAGAASRDPGTGMGTMMGGMSMAQRRFLSFTRGQEEGADQAAVTFLDRLGWSSKGLATLFQKLEQEEALDVSRQDPYLNTHPLTPDRIAFVQNHLAHSRFTNAPLPGELDSGFAMVKAKLDGFLDAPGPALRRYSGQTPTPAVRYARAVLNHRQGDSAGAVQLLDGLIREQPGNPWLYELKGQVLFEAGQGRAAIAPYQQAMKLAPDQPLLRQSLAHVMIESNDPALLRPAIDHLEYALRYDREDDETWHWLGIAWGRLGNIGEANLALAEEAMLQNNIRVARRFATAAAGALPAGPSRMRALDISNAVKKENRL